MDTETRAQRIARLRAESVRQADGTYRASCRVGAYRLVIPVAVPDDASPSTLEALRRSLQDAGDRRDWDECDRIEAEIDRLKEATP